MVRTKFEYITRGDNTKFRHRLHAHLADLEQIRRASYARWRDFTWSGLPSASRSTHRNSRVYLTASAHLSAFRHVSSWSVAGNALFPSHAVCSLVRSSHKHEQRVNVDRPPCGYRRWWAAKRPPTRSTTAIANRRSLHEHMTRGPDRRSIHTGKTVRW